MYDIQKIAAILSATFSNEVVHPSNITQLLFDSRRVSLPHGSLFFAIKGARHDGHDYIENAYKKGVRNFVVSALPPAPKGESTRSSLGMWANSPLGAGGLWSNANFLLVENTLQALQTIIKEWLYELLREEHNIVRSPKSYNSQIGVPLSVWQIDETHDLGIFEAGISQLGEMEKLARIIQPDIGLLTNIGEAHSEGFESIEEKLREKMRLFFSCKTIIFRNDNELINNVMIAMSDTSKVSDIFTWGRNENANLHIKKIEKKSDSTILYANLRHRRGVHPPAPSKGGDTVARSFSRSGGGQGGGERAKYPNRSPLYRRCLLGKYRALLGSHAPLELR